MYRYQVLFVKKSLQSMFIPPSAPGLIFSRFFENVDDRVRNHGPDPPYVAVFPDPSVAGSLKSALGNSSPGVEGDVHT